MCIALLRGAETVRANQAYACEFWVSAFPWFIPPKAWGWGKLIHTINSGLVC